VGDDLAPFTMAVLVGRPVSHLSSSGREVRTAFRKQAVDGPVQLGMTNLEGDEQADLRHHGGPDKAVLACSADHAQAWRRIAPELADPGAFGENVHVAGLAEADVCIGDRWRIGTAELEISQPRRPCWKVEDRWGRQGLVELMETTSRTGWYFRVLSTGTVQAGDRWELLDRPNPSWSIERANDVVHHRRDDLDSAVELAAMPELSASWRQTFIERVDRLRAGVGEDVAAVESSRRSGPD